MTRHSHAVEDSLEVQVDQVGRISLTGAPHTIVVDDWALFSPEGNIPRSLAAKLEVFTRQEGMRLIVLSEQGDMMREALPEIPNLCITASPPAERLDGTVLAVLARQVPLPPHVYAWYVGAEGLHAPFRPTRFTGVQGTDEILGLYGTALVQERAGIAFRAAGAENQLPTNAPFDTGILDGVARAVTHHPEEVERLTERGREHPRLDLDRDADRLITAALPPILAAQGKSGAVAAAPSSHDSGEPNYSFFWQRDAGQVVLALADLAKHRSATAVQASARSFVRKYVAFVEALPYQAGRGTADLGVSRFAMTGRPIGSYGNPQKDGPAHTVLAVLAALGETARAYRVSKPYLEYLSEYIFGPSFDPWEFAAADVLFDYNLARRALRAGARLAQMQHDGSAEERYRTVAEELEKEMERFMSPACGYVLAGRNYLQPFLATTSHLDLSVIGSILTAYDPEDSLLNVDHPLILQTVRKLECAWAQRWPVNVAWQRNGNAGMGMGRFPEDANDGIGSTGGNPWTFATLWAAQFYLRLAQRRDVPGVEDAAMQRAALLETADGYLLFVLNHMSPHALTEQIDGQTGRPRGARKLAWAQAALIQNLLIRRKVRTDFTEMVGKPGP